MIPVEIARLCEPGADREAAERAVAFARESQLALEHRAARLVRDRDLDALLEQAREALSAQLEACRRVLAGDRAAARDARRAAERLQELEPELARPRMAYAPFGPADELIKVGMNVLDGVVRPVQLESRLPSVVTLANALEEDVERFERLYGGGPSVEQARAGLAEVQAGLGAALEWARTSERGPLEDSLKLLVAGFARLSDALREFDRVARPWLEELGMACSSGDHELKVGCWRRAERFFYQLCSGLDSFHGFPYLGLMQAEHDRAQRAVRDLGALMSRAGAQPENHLAELESAFEAATGAVGALYRRRAEELARYRGAPEVEELRELVFRGDLPALLREKIELFRRRAAELEPDLRDPQLAALALMESDPTAGWEAFEAELPALLSLRDALRPEKAASAPGVSCFRCGASNAPERRFCSACQAVLPSAAPASVTEYADVVGEEPELPSHVARLEELVRAGDSAALEREVESLLDRAEALLRQFDQNVLPAARHDQVVEAYARFFEERVQEFVEGLVMLREGATRGGLERCRAAGSELLAMQRKIQA